MGFVFLLSLILLFSPSYFSQSSVLSESDALHLRIKKDDHETVVPSSSLDPTRITQLSWRPRLFLYEGFLSDEECDHLISLTRGHLQRSRVVDKNGERILSETRTSWGMYLHIGHVPCNVICTSKQFMKYNSQDEIVASIEERIAAWTFLPKENGEMIQVIHYGHGQQVTQHTDYFEDSLDLESGGQRIVTVVMYLSDTTKGGETVFPYLWNYDFGSEGNSSSHCANGGYAVKPKKGNALLLFDLQPNLSMDRRSTHESCPVMEGEKWCAVKLIHVKSYNEPEWMQRQG